MSRPTAGRSSNGSSTTSIQCSMGSFRRTRTSTAPAVHGSPRLSRRCSPSEKAPDGATGDCRRYDPCTATTSPSFVYGTPERPQASSRVPRVLDALVDDSVPEHGIGTETLKSRLDDLVRAQRTGSMARPHGEPESIRTRRSLTCRGLPSNVSWLAIGRDDQST